MSNAIFCVPYPKNEPVLAYLPGSCERASLKAELERQSSELIKIPLIIDGKEIYTETSNDFTMPCDHGHVLAQFCIAKKEHLKMAVDASLKAKHDWENMPWEMRASIFLKAAELLAGPYRFCLNAATMLGQGKTVYQAEIDSACELIDFLRFNVYFAEQIFKIQPDNSPGVWNRSLYRSLEGFIMAISPFNFTAICGNLCTAPAMLGNTIVWKPATTAILSNYYFMKLLMEAGLPPGVINFVPSKGSDVSEHILNHPQLAGIHFTGSTKVFHDIWSQIGRNISNYHSYPRLVGETGGKDFVFAHSTADVDALVVALVRGAFEYQGQKCSAASRAFIPESLWAAVKEKLLMAVTSIKMGDVRDFTNFLGAVIDSSSFKNIAGYIDRAKTDPSAELLCGSYDDSKGYFISPTVILCKHMDHETMVDEIFGPVLSIYVYPDDKLEETLKGCDSSSYALTGSIFAKDRQAILLMSLALQNAAGNFYINDKPTGAVVGQQPFGGARASGTNDKSGSALNLYRWLSVQTIKENLLPVYDIEYPYMKEK